MPWNAALDQGTVFEPPPPPLCFPFFSISESSVHYIQDNRLLIQVRRNFKGATTTNEAPRHSILRISMHFREEIDGRNE